MLSRESLTALVVLLTILAGHAPMGPAPSGKSRDATPVRDSSVLAFGAVGDGKTDDTAAIQRAVDAKVGGVRFVRGAYRITRPIAIDLDRVGPVSIVGDGTATVVMDGPGPAFRFLGTHAGTASPGTFQPNVWERQRSPMVDGIEIVGRHERASGVEARGTMQMMVTRVVIRKVLHGIHLVQRNRNVIISDCHIYENRGAGIFYDRVNLHQSNITGCHISYNDAGGIVIRGGDVRNVHIGSCDIEGNMSADGPPTANILLDAAEGSIGELAIVGCTIQHSHLAPGSANIRIDGRSARRPFTKELRHGNITIADNVLSDVQTNVDVRNARGVTITGNTMWKGYTCDLRVAGSDSIVVADNVFDRNPRYHYGDGSRSAHGLVFTDSSGCTISGNHIQGTGDIPAAVVLERCRRVNVTGSTILDARRVGLLMKDVHDSRISGCLIRDDRAVGGSLSLEISGGSGNMIVGNLLGSKPRISESAGFVKDNIHP